MKYIRIIILILGAATALTVLYLWPQHPETKKDVVATINGYQLEKSKMQQDETTNGAFPSMQHELLHSAITRELLIQEAQRQKIDKEEDFRHSLKTFYEQSLIKILMDRKYSELSVAVTEEEIDRYLAFFGRTIRFTRLPVSSSPPFTPTSENGQQNEILFDDLADSLKHIIATLVPGQHTIKFDTGYEQYAIRLDAVSSLPGQASLPHPGRQLVRALLEQNKKEQMITQWLVELRNKATITIHNQ